MIARIGNTDHSGRGARSESVGLVAFSVFRRTLVNAECFAVSRYVAVIGAALPVAVVTRP
jgi:hypothetical protein